MPWDIADLSEAVLAFTRSDHAVSTRGLRMNWLRLIRFLTQYLAPGLASVVVTAEIMGWLLGAQVSPSLTHAYYYALVIVFSLLTAIMVGICGWIVFLWDLDRLFFKLESKIDAQIAASEL